MEAIGCAECRVLRWLYRGVAVETVASPSQRVSGYRWHNKLQVCISFGNGVRAWPPNVPLKRPFLIPRTEYKARRPRHWYQYPRSFAVHELNSLSFKLTRETRQVLRRYYRESFYPVTAVCFSDWFQRFELILKSYQIMRPAGRISEADNEFEIRFQTLKSSRPRVVCNRSFNVCKLYVCATVGLRAGGKKLILPNRDYYLWDACIYTYRRCF